MEVPPMIIDRGIFTFDSIALDNGSKLTPVEAAYEDHPQEGFTLVHWKKI